MSDYDARFHPTIHYCPDCANRRPPRMSLIEWQEWGSGDKWYRCSDWSLCRWKKLVKSGSVGDFGE